MRIVIRADASLDIGSGHIMRCLVLADAFKRKGHHVSFACQSLPGDLNTYIAKRGYTVTVLKSTPKTQLNEELPEGYLFWLQRTELEDANDFLKCVSQVDAVVTDHYAIGKEWHNIVKGAFDCKVIAIDDLVRDHNADIIIDQTLGRVPSEYTSSSTVLAGSEFALLAPMFAKKREHAFDIAALNAPIKVLVSMGGVDKPNATMQTLQTLINEDNIRITVLLNPLAPHYEEVTEWIALHENVVHQDFTENMADLMLQHDIAIGAPGTTSWERACLGIPSVLIPLAHNQKTNCEKLIQQRAIEVVSLDRIKSELIPAINTLTREWHKYRDANLVICDGLGTNRVVEAIERLLFSDDSLPVAIRLANESDIKTVFEWQCHPETRKYALNPETPSWEQHQNWMRKKLTHIADFFYVITWSKKQDPVGVVRLDRVSAGNYLISIFIDPKQHGKGIALKALSLIDDIHQNINIHATVLKDNQASQCLFTKAGYERISKEKFIRKELD